MVKMAKMEHLGLLAQQELKETLAYPEKTDVTG